VVYSEKWRNRQAVTGGGYVRNPDTKQKDMVSQFQLQSVRKSAGPGQGRREHSSRTGLEACIAISRDFCDGAAGFELSGTILGSSRVFVPATIPKEKRSGFTFGGGARDQETFAPEGRKRFHTSCGILSRSQLLSEW